MTEAQHYQYWASHFAGEAILLRKDASVHVEDFDDAVFWEKTFTHILPGKEFNFVWASNSFSGNLSTGCAQCLKYKDYLSERFFICIDSDYRYLLQDAGMTAAHHIFQTYTYSIENHLCFATKLNAIPEKCTGIPNTVFDFEAFLLAYSLTVYDALIWHLYFLRIGDIRTFSKNDFQLILSLTGMRGFSINTHGAAIISELTNRCATKVDQLTTAHPSIDIDAEKSYFATLGLLPHNAYLYVRGHNLFELIKKIGKELNNQLLASKATRLTNPQQIQELFAKSTPFERELERQIVFDGYNEMEKIKSDIISHL